MGINNLPRMSVPGSRSDVRLLGRSEAIRSIEADVECAARSDAKVLITGETGVGKEVVARLIHDRSARSSAPLVAVNCAGLPDSLLESELFGHGRGSFTGAYRDKPGLLEMAPNGTVFLDEVGEMSVRMQVVLLRFLETGEIQRLGADRSHTRVNIRLITATNRDLLGQITNGNFREDLYFRLNVIRISIPPLRERAADIPLLVDHFLHAYGRQHQIAPPEMTPAAMEALVAHRWPGNIRELKNVIERVVLRSEGTAIRLSDLPQDITGGTKERGGGSRAEPVADAKAVRRPIAEELAARMIEHGESFWTVVYPLFMSRDLTREDMRRIVRIGLEKTSGNYRLLTRQFGMTDDDYKRFLGFLRKHECHLPFQRFRVARVPGVSTDKANTDIA
jgi:DNA-binding NtrC family response regulator